MDKPIPVRVKELEDPDSFTERMIEWLKDPSLHPDIDLIQKYGVENVYITDQDVREAELAVYYAKYQEAQKLQDPDEALKIYLDILKKHTPIGMSYYLEPIYILEKKGQYEKALSICRTALEVSQLEYIHFSVEELEQVEERLLKSINNKSL